MGKRRVNNQLYIVQARPETVHGKDKKQVREIYKLKEKVFLSHKESHWG
jgi:pyruvate,water dikinase